MYKRKKERPYYAPIGHTIVSFPKGFPQMHHTQISEIGNPCHRFQDIKACKVAFVSLDGIQETNHVVYRIDDYLVEAVDPFVHSFGRQCNTRRRRRRRRSSGSSDGDGNCDCTAAIRSSRNRRGLYYCYYRILSCCCRRRRCLIRWKKGSPVSIFWRGGVSKLKRTVTVTVTEWCLRRDNANGLEGLYYHKRRYRRSEECDERTTAGKMIRGKLHSCL